MCSFLRKSLPAALIVLLAPTLVDAGAWPREPGRFFFSVKSEYETASGEFRTSAYGEYGLSRRITLGFEASDGPPDPAKQDEYEWQRERGGELVLIPPSGRRVGSFVNLAIGPLNAVDRFALSFGASAPPDQYGLMMEYRVEVAAHWGRGFTSRWGNGWATATAKVIFARDEDEPAIDLYGLLGVKPREEWMSMIGLGRYTDATGTTWKISPSIGYRPIERLWVVPTLAYGFGDGNTEAAFGVGFWLNF